MYKLVLLRHGESEWNRENLFTGWTDIGLSQKGEEEARHAGVLLKQGKYRFDVAYTSLLKRAIKTLWLTLDMLDMLWIPVVKHWRLNERHYGDLQGFNKAQMAAEVGEEQVQIWRRSYDVPPPPLDDQDRRQPRNDPRYANVPPNEIPDTECLKDTVRRCIPYWEVEIAPRIIAGQRLLIVAHGNSLRALVKHLDKIGDDSISSLNVPTGIPLVYDLNSRLQPIRRRYLGDPETARRAAEAVANQSKAQ